MAISYDEAVNIAKKFAEELNDKYNNKILAVFTIGSLGGDYYRPGQSDIDTVVITSCNREEATIINGEIETIADKYWKKYDVPKGFGAIVFAEEQLYPPYIAKEELILEILRLMTQSKLIYGNYDIKKIPLPDKQAMIDNENAFEDWMAESAKKANQGNEAEPQISFSELDKQVFVNGTLWHIRRFLMINRDIIEFNKFKLIDLYLKNNPPIVDDVIFKTINNVLHDSYDLITDEQMQTLSKWRDNFRVQMLKIVLNR
jgi:hypothetical protein